MLSLLRDLTGDSELGWREPPRSLIGGQWARIYAFRLRGSESPVPQGPLVLRLIPNHPDGQREFLVQSALANAGFPTPRVHFIGIWPSGEWRYAITDRAPGRPLSTPGLLGLRRVTLALADLMSTLHKMPLTHIRTLMTEGMVAPATLTACLAEIGAYARSSGQESLIHGHDWLLANQPIEGPLVICHGDVHPANALIEAGRVSALLDWSNVRLAPAEFDVSYVTLGSHASALARAVWLRPLIGWLGRRGAARFVAAYEHNAPVDRTTLPWYEALHSLRFLATLATGRLALASPGEERRNPANLIAPAFREYFRKVSGIELTTSDHEGAAALLTGPEQDHG